MPEKFGGGGGAKYFFLGAEMPAKSIILRDTLGNLRATFFGQFKG